LHGEDGVGGECGGGVGAGDYCYGLEVGGGEEGFEDLGADCAACLVLLLIRCWTDLGGQTAYAHESDALDLVLLGHCRDGLLCGLDLEFWNESLIATEDTLL
jgi:hypothetical protein